MFQGYFQLKAGPGLWTLSLRDGPSKEIYQVTGVEGPGDLEEGGQVLVTVGDLTSTFITVEVSGGTRSCSIFKFVRIIGFRILYIMFMEI